MGQRTNTNAWNCPTLSRALQSHVFANSDPPHTTRTLILGGHFDGSTSGKKMMAAQNLTTALLNVIGAKSEKSQIKHPAPGLQVFQRDDDTPSWIIPLDHPGASRGNIHQIDKTLKKTALSQSEHSSSQHHCCEPKHLSKHFGRPGATTTLCANHRLVACTQSQGRRSPTIAIPRIRPNPQSESDRLEHANAVHEFLAPLRQNCQPSSKDKPDSTTRTRGLR